MSKIYVLNGPNLNLLGSREPEVYGTLSLEEITKTLTVSAAQLGAEISCHQTNSEDQLIQWLHQAFKEKANVILNPAAFTHYSYALRDACAVLTTSGQKLIEVHLTNPHAREAFRHTSVISAVATGVIAGFGVDSYLLALEQLARH